MSDTHAGMVIAGRYEVGATLGKGAFGCTFLARDLQRDGAEVAVKMLDAQRAQDLKSFELFEREAAVLRTLRHHGIPEVYDSFRDTWQGAGAAFLVMEYVPGESLAAMIADQRHLEPATVLSLLNDMLGILEYLHGRVPPILHRDIKPANILVRPDGMPVLVDFGAVRRVFLGPVESGSTVVGTYGYMPYEQHVGLATPASDLYALGATFLHLLTGRPPSDFMTDEGRLAVPEDLPGDARLAAVIERALRASPGERFRSAREMREALLAPAGAVSHALVPAGTASTAVALDVLPPAPRAIEGPTRELYRRLAWPFWRIADGSAKPVKGSVLSYTWDVVAWGFFSVITAGVLPMVFISIAAARRRRVRQMLRDGIPAAAEITGMQLVDLAFAEKLAHVSYQFSADGRLHRDSDKVLPAIADRWRVGDRITVFYIPERDYDSMIVSGS